MSNTPYFDAYERRRYLRQGLSGTATINVNSQGSGYSPTNSVAIGTGSTGLTGTFTTTNSSFVSAFPTYRLHKEYAYINGIQVLIDIHLEIDGYTENDATVSYHSPNEAVYEV